MFEMSVSWFYGAIFGYYCYNNNLTVDLIYFDNIKHRFVEFTD